MMANDVDILAAPIEPFVMLNEIDPDKISNIDRLKDFIFLCDAGLKFLDDEFALDAESRAFADMSEPEFIAEGLKHHRSSTADKIKAAKRYRNRRQFILRRKREAGQKATAKVIAMKMALSKKTPKGKPKKENNICDSIDRRGWLGRGTTYEEWMKPANDKNSAEMREFSKEWAKPAPKCKYVVEHLNDKTNKMESIDADLYTIRICKEINRLLREEK
jgi:hypothetical protein